jgi:hypothetical protein
VEDISLDKSI